MATIVVFLISLSVCGFTMLFLLQLCTLWIERDRASALAETKLRMKRAKYSRWKRKTWKMELKEKKKREKNEGEGEGVRRLK